MEHTLSLALSHATEVAAIAASRAAGFGNKNAADDAAVKAMREFLNTVPFHGRVVIGEGERDEAPMLYIGEELGTLAGKSKADKDKATDTRQPDMIDIAVDPLENTNATASLGPRALAVLAASEEGGLFHAPDMYMNKLIVPPEAAGKVSLDDPVKTTLTTLAKVLNRSVSDLVIVVLDRDRHEELISDIRETGARVKLIPDGDLLPGVAACMRGTNIHAVMGIGAAPEGVMTAAAMRCLNGYMQARFWPKNKDEETRLVKMGGKINKIYTHEELASGKDIVFCATGVTTGDILKGVSFFGSGARTHTLMMTNQSGKIRMLDTTHVFDKEKMRFRL